MTQTELDLARYGGLRKGDYMGIYGHGGFEQARFYPSPKKILTTFRQTNMDYFGMSKYFDIVPVTVTEPPEIIDVTGTVIENEALPEAATKKLSYDR